MEKKHQQTFGAAPWAAAAGALLSAITATIVSTMPAGMSVPEAVRVLPVLIVVPLLTLLVTEALLRRTTTGPVKAIGSALSSVAEGNLTIRVETKDASRTIQHLLRTINEDLIGGLQIVLLGMRDLIDRNAGIGDSFHEEADSAREAMEGVLTEVQAVRDQIVTLDERVSRSAGAVEQISATVRSMAQQVDEQGSSVEQTASAVEETAASIDNVASIAQNRGEVSQRLLQVTSTGARQVQDLAEVVQDLARGIDDMLGIVSVINTVASRTNLLAMNAAIEAAHAGEYGRGFAVVAEEIRSLAESTATNTKKISSSLKGYVERIRAAHEAGSTAGEALQEIEREVQSFVDAFTEITQGTGEAATGTREIVTMVHNLNDLTSRIGEAAREMDSGTREITEGLTSIREFSGETRERMEAVDTSTQRGREAQERIATHARENSEQLQQLQTELRYFILDRNTAETKRAYSADLRRIILDHKRRAMSARLLTEGGIGEKQAPRRMDGSECLLGKLIEEAERTENSAGHDLGDLKRDHQKFHDLYNQFLTAFRASQTEHAVTLAREIESAWKGLVPYREQVNNLFDRE